MYPGARRCFSRGYILRFASGNAILEADAVSVVLGRRVVRFVRE
jgi:hypothetical protein